MTNLLVAAENPLVQRLGWTLLHFLWQGALLGACIGLGQMLLRRGSSSARYNLLLAGFGLMTLSPIITFVVVTPARPEPLEVAEPAGPVQALAVVPVPQEMPTTYQEAGAFPLLEPTGLTPQLPPFPQNDPVTVSQINQQTLDPAPAMEPTLAHRVMPVFPWLVAGWLLGVVILSLRLIGAWRRIQQLVKCDVRELDARWAEVGRRLLNALQIRRTVRFLESKRAVVPVVVGWLKPVVVVPTAVLTNLSFEEAEALLAHELAHIRRWDEVVNLLQTVVETLLFYHPAVWLVSARLRQEREHCCDDLAAEVVGDRLVYSRALFAAAQLATQRPHRLAVAATGGKLQQRIQRLLNGAPPHRVKARWPVAVALSIVGCLSIGILACSPPADDPLPVAETTPADEPVESGTADVNTSDTADEETVSDPPTTTVEVPQGTPPDTIAGHVLDPAGDPVDSARVYLLTEAQKLTIFNVQDELRPRVEGDGPERLDTTDSEGHFSVSNSEDWNRIAIVADQCPLWVVERSELETLNDVQLRLPETGEVSVIVDIPEEEETVELLIGLQSFDGRVWRRDGYVRNYYEVDNLAETVLSGFPPGTYSVERVDTIKFENHGLMHACERQIIAVTAEESAVVSFSRQFGVPVSGTVRGLDRDDLGHASLAIQYWGPEEAPLPDGRHSRTMTYFDGLKLDRDGTFTTQPMPPGEYAFYVNVFLGDRTGGSADLRGSVLVNVPVSGEVTDVSIDVSPDARVLSPRVPDDPAGVEAALEEFDQQLSDEPELTPERIVAGIEQTMQQFISVEYSGEYEEVRDANAFQEDAEPLNFTGTGHYQYRSDGRRWFADEHGFTHNVGSTDIHPTHELSGFDGSIHYIRKGKNIAGESDIVTLGEDSLAVERRAPHQVFWEIGKNWSWLKSALESPTAAVKDHPVINGFTCVNILSEREWPGGELTFQYEIVISPEQSFLPISCVIRKNGELETTWSMEDLAQTDDGLWYPGTIVTEHADPFPTRSEQLTITSLARRDDFTDEDFAYPVPAGVDIVDYPGSRVYFNDPWWRELQTLLSERFDKPTPWLSPTDEMGSFADGAIDGQPAPAIEAREWINGDPGAWDRPDRNYTVLFFFGGRAISPTPKWLAGLKALQQKYGDGGLDLMGVVSSDATEGAKQTALEYGMKFPIAIAAASDESGSYGRPHDAFGLQHYAGVFVIDPDGIVHAVNSPQLEGTAQLQLEPLVQQLMGLPADEFARPDTGLSRPEWDTVVNEWRSLRDAAPADSIMTGQVTVDQSASIDFTDFDLTLSPMLRLVSGHTAYGHTQQIDEADSITVSCDATGRYEFPGLTKGTYRLTAIGPGIERHERIVAIVGEESGTVVDLTITSSD